MANYTSYVGRLFHKHAEAYDQAQLIMSTQPVVVLIFSISLMTRFF